MRFTALAKPTRSLCIATSAVVLASAAVGSGVLHLRLESSDPPDGAVVTELPAQLRLVFSAAIERGLAEVRLTNSDGSSIPATVLRDSADHRVLLGTWPDLTAGEWEIAWKVVSLDGHTVRNTFTFTYDPPRAQPGTGAAGDSAAEGAEAESGAESVPSGDASDDGDAGDAASYGGSGSAFPWFAALLSGAARWFLLAFAGLAWFDHRRRVDRASRPGGLTRLLAAGAVLFVATSLGQWIVSAGGFGAGGLSDVLATRTGRLGLLQLGLTTLAAVAAFRWRPRAAAIIAVIAILVDGATGHPAALESPFAVPLSAAHLAAAAVWLGGVLLILAEDRNEHHLMATSTAVSRAALIVSVLVGVTGLGQALLFVPDLGSVVSTAYGRLIVAKAIGFAILIGFGAHHRLRLIPVIETTGTGAALQRSVRKEALVFMLVILVAAVLGQTTPPA